MELRLPAPCLLVLVGPSSSGKSTWARDNFAPSEVVSSDALRAMVGAGEDDQAASPAAFEVLERIVTERARRQLTTVIDTLGFDADARARWIDTAHRNGLPVFAIVFDTPPQVCIERNRASEKSIPVTALRRQIARMKQVAPSLDDEQFDGVHRVQAVAVVNPDVVVAAASASSASPNAAHTFGLIVSRFNWGASLGETLRSIAQRAENAGFRDIWVMDHFRQIRGVGRPWEDIPEAYTALAHMAAVTSRIRLGTLVTSVTHRHPIIMGKMMATLDVLSGGRAVCGLGIGWDADEHASFGVPYPETAERFEILEETLQMLPLLWGKGTPAFSGRHIDSPGLICYPRPIQERIPILIGGSGERKTLRLVARYADACNLFGDPERVAHKVDVLRRHCEEVERDPNQIEVTHLLTMLSAPDRKTLRARVDQMRGRNRTAEEYARRANAGVPDDHVALIGAYRSAGATHSIVALPDVSLPGSIESFGTVIARFGSS